MSKSYTTFSLSEIKFARIRRHSDNAVLEVPLDQLGEVHRFIPQQPNDFTFHTIESLCTVLGRLQESSMTASIEFVAPKD